MDEVSHTAPRKPLSSGDLINKAKQAAVNQASKTAESHYNAKEARARRKDERMLKSLDPTSRAIELRFRKVEAQTKEHKIGDAAFSAVGTGTTNGSALTFAIQWINWNSDTGELEFWTSDNVKYAIPFTTCPP